jgi:hypothetical protein
MMHAGKRFPERSLGESRVLSLCKYRYFPLTREKRDPVGNVTYFSSIASIHTTLQKVEQAVVEKHRRRSDPREQAAGIGGVETT